MTIAGTLVEKVARAIALSAGGKITGPSRHRASDEFKWDPSHNYMQKYVDAHWKEHVHAATFAIEAMRSEILAKLTWDEEGLEEWFEKELGEGTEIEQIRPRET